MCEDVHCALNVHDSPFVSLKRAADLADEEQVTGRELFKELHDASLRSTVSYFHAALSEAFTFNSIIEKRDCGKIGEFRDVFDGNIGFKIKKRFDKYQSMNIQSLVIRASADATKTIFIEDACGITEKTVNLKCGLNRVNIDYWTKTGEVSIYINSCDLQLATDYSSTYTYDCRDFPDCKEDYGCYYSCGCFEIEEFKDDGTTRSLTDTGLYLCLRCVSDPYQMICDYKHLLEVPHQLMFEFMIHQTHIATQRMNPFARNGKDIAERRIKEIMGGVIDGFVVERPLFKEALKVAVKSAKNSICELDFAESNGNHIVNIIP